MDQQQSFMDKKTLLAIVLIAVVWFGWQAYMQSKYPKQEAALTPATETKKIVESTPETKPLAAATAEGAKPSVEKTFQYEDARWKFLVSSQGMGLKDIALKGYTDRHNSSMRIGASGKNLPLGSYLNDSKLEFDITKDSETEFTGRAKYDGMTVTKKLKVDSGTYTVTSAVEIDGDLSKLKTFSYILSEDIYEKAEREGSGKRIESDPSLWQSYFVAHDTTNDHHATSKDTPLKERFDNVSVGALNGKYFGQAIVDDSQIAPHLRADYSAGDEEYLAWITYDLSGQKSVELNAKFFAGPKSLDTLIAADARLEKSANFGMFGWLAGPLLKLMKWLYELTQNYGAAIVLMTILVRIAVAPFNLASYKSMKAMQVIQPKVNKLKEKYKDDPQTMNREMMKLMKDNNANPLMGCLPMLLQLPVFFALYQVLDQSIELYKAPFMWWIYDLSLKDHFYVLPALMGITMFIQQKITPTAMDPAQAKVMLMMPIVFTFLMVSLPSGLTLYIFISTLFGITQQFLFMRSSPIPGGLRQGVTEGG